MVPSQGAAVICSVIIWKRQGNVGQVGNVRSAKEPAPWTLIIPSDLRLLTVARGFIESICQIGNLEPTICDAVVLAAHEAVSNVMRHAHRDRPECPLQIQCYLGPASVEIRLLDEG